LAGAPIGNQNAANGKKWQAAIFRALEARSRIAQKEALDLLAEKLLARCDEADLQALKELGDRVDGKSAQGVEVSGPDGGAIIFKLSGDEANL
jgi:hypothetical protein